MAPPVAALPLHDFQLSLVRQGPVRLEGVVLGQDTVDDREQAALLVHAGNGPGGLDVAVIQEDHP